MGEFQSYPQLTAPAIDDILLVRDTSATATKKVEFKNILPNVQIATGLDEGGNDILAFFDKDQGSITNNGSIKFMFGGTDRAQVVAHANTPSVTEWGTGYAGLMADNGDSWIGLGHSNATSIGYAGLDLGAYSDSNKNYIYITANMFEGATPLSYPLDFVSWYEPGNMALSRTSLTLWGWKTQPDPYFTIWDLEDSIPHFTIQGPGESFPFNIGTGWILYDQSPDTTKYAYLYASTSQTNTTGDAGFYIDSETSPSLVGLYTARTSAGNYNTGLLLYSVGTGVSTLTVSSDSGTGSYINLLKGSNEYFRVNDTGQTVFGYNTTKCGAMLTPNTDDVNFQLYSHGTNNANISLNVINNNALINISPNTGGGAWLQIDESPSPPTGQNDSVRLYTVDNGSGKTKLMAQFGTGSPVQVAIEP